jgi:phage terminase large subunit-like protein
MPTFELTAKQVELRNTAASPATHILAYGGSRSGKTFCFVYCIATRAISAPNSRHLIARLHNIDVRQAVLMDTWPAVMRAAYPDVVCTTNKSDQFVTLPNGAEVWFGGLDDKERVDKILGKEFATIYVNESSQVAYDTILTLRTRLAQNVTKANGAPLKLKAYYDLNPVGRGHWTHKEFVEHVRPENGQPLTGSGRAHVVLNPEDNRANLSQDYLDELAAMPERHRQRFYEGKYLSEVPGTLWPTADIDAARVTPSFGNDGHLIVIHNGAVIKLTRIVVAIDPSGSDGTGGDRQGIVVVGLGEDGRGYVLEDASVRMAPAGWARKVVERFHHWKADKIVAEINYGGAMVESTIRTADSKVPVKVEHASRGKHIRAEPVASLYELKKISHVGRFPELEEQMGMFTTSGYQGGDSPDRVDALVWALSELMLKKAVPVAQSGQQRRN